VEQPLVRAEAAAVPPVQSLVTVVAEAAVGPPAQPGPRVPLAVVVTQVPLPEPVVTPVQLEERLAQAAGPLVLVALPVTRVAVVRA
jgi:hypothetical protein